MINELGMINRQCLWALFGILCTCAVPVVSLARTERAVIANAECGKVQGSWVEMDNAFVFRGIPYAEPPVGQLRWKPPVPVSRTMNNCWNGTLMAQVFGNACYQRASESSNSGDEDCLYMNVWTPDLDPTSPLPVMFWIHGGYLLSGNGNMGDFGYAPTPKLAHDTNTVYVSINYRLHAFGFMALEWLREKSPHNTSGNYGFMDMVTALQWVQQNIRYFGGDPNQVTVFGQSSGGTSIFALLGSPLSKGLFHKAWLLSASPVLNKTAADAFKENEVFVRNTNCSDVDCLYSLSAHDVTSSVPWDEYPYWAMDDLFGLPVKGRFDGALPIVDGYVLPEAPFDAWTHGQGVDVPLIIGTTAQEVDLIPNPRGVKNWTWASGKYEFYVRACLGTFGDGIAAAALRLYPPGIETPEYQYTSMASDLRVTCGNDHLGQIAARTFRSPVYRYVTTYSPSRPFTFPYPARYSAHGIDAFGFFGGLEHLIRTKSTSDLQWESNVQNEIMAFVKSGKPASSRWKPYPESTALLSVNTTVVRAYHKAECHFWLSNGFFSYSLLN